MIHPLVLRLTDSGYEVRTHDGSVVWNRIQSLRVARELAKSIMLDVAKPASKQAA